MERERGSMEADLNYICCCGQRGSCRGASALLEMEAAAAADRVSCSGGCSAPQRLGASVDGRSGARAAPRPPRRPCLAARFPPRLPRGPARSRSSTARPESSSGKIQMPLGPTMGVGKKGRARKRVRRRGGRRHVVARRVRDGSGARREVDGAGEEMPGCQALGEVGDVRLAHLSARTGRETERGACRSEEARRW